MKKVAKYVKGPILILLMAFSLNATASETNEKTKEVWVKKFYEDGDFKAFAKYLFEHTEDIEEPGKMETLTGLWNTLLEKHPNLIDKVNNDEAVGDAFEEAMMAVYDDLNLSSASNQGTCFSGAHPCCTIAGFGLERICFARLCPGGWADCR